MSFTIEDFPSFKLQIKTKFLLNLQEVLEKAGKFNEFIHVDIFFDSLISHDNFVNNFGSSLYLISNFIHSDKKQKLNKKLELEFTKKLNKLNPLNKLFLDYFIHEKKLSIGNFKSKNELIHFLRVFDKNEDQNAKINAEIASDELIDEANNQKYIFSKIPILNNWKIKPFIKKFIEENDIKIIKMNNNIIHTIKNDINFNNEEDGNKINCSDLIFYCKNKSKIEEFEEIIHNFRIYEFPITKFLQEKNKIKLIQYKIYDFILENYEKELRNESEKKFGTNFIQFEKHSNQFFAKIEGFEEGDKKFINNLHFLIKEIAVFYNEKYDVNVNTQRNLDKQCQKLKLSLLAQNIKGTSIYSFSDEKKFSYKLLLIGFDKYLREYSEALDNYFVSFEVKEINMVK